MPFWKIDTKNCQCKLTFRFPLSTVSHLDIVFRLPMLLGISDELDEVELLAFDFSDAWKVWWDLFTIKSFPIHIFLRLWPTHECNREVSIDRRRTVHNHGEYLLSCQWYCPPPPSKQARQWTNHGKLLSVCNLLNVILPYEMAMRS